MSVSRDLKHRNNQFSTKERAIFVTGVLSNMQQFFDSLRTNLESLEQLPQDEREALLGQQVPTPAGTYCTSCPQSQRQEQGRNEAALTLAWNLWANAALSITTAVSCGFTSQSCLHDVHRALYV
jgi:hypothetical protein